MAPPAIKSAALREDVHFRVLRLLSENPAASQRDISNALGVSLGLVNYCLNALVEKGAVKISNFRAADNKLRYAYVLTPSGLSEKVHLTGQFLQRKIQEFEALKAEIDALLEEAKLVRPSVDLQSAFVPFVVEHRIYREFPNTLRKIEDE